MECIGMVEVIESKTTLLSLLNNEMKGLTYFALQILQISGYW